MTPLKFIASCRLPTEYGIFTMHGFEEPSGQEHIALSMGDIANGEPVLSRIHSECLTGDALFSQKCDCGPQLQAAMQAVQREGRGVIVYLRQEGRGIGLMAKMAAYKLQEEGYDTVDANVHLGYDPDERDYGVGAQILRSLGITKIRLITNNPVKRVGLEAYGLEIVENVPMEITPTPYNERYLRTKKERMSHNLHFQK